MAGERVRSGRPQKVLETFWPASTPVHLVYPHSRLLAAKVRAFVDWAGPRLTAELARLAVPDLA
jgi:DNA-binding transcriptional LysR family regulator